MTVRPPFVYEAISRAEGLLAVNRPGQAELIAREALASVPENAKLLELLVRSLMDQAEHTSHAEAMRVAEKLVEVAPQAWQSYFYFSQAHRLAVPNPVSVWRNALPAAERAVELAPHQADVHANLALTLAATASPFSFRVWERAAEAAAEAVALAPNWPGAHIVAAEVARWRYRRGEAARHAERALQLAPGSADALRVATESATRVRVRRGFAARLAFTAPSDDARVLVIETHRATPAGALGPGLLAGVGFIAAEAASYGGLGTEPETMLWVVSPGVGVWIAAMFLVTRKRRLNQWEPEIRGAVFDNEWFWRWPRRVCMAALLVLPALWLPASLEGSHAGAWLIAWIIAGGAFGILLRPKFRLQRRSSGS